jgi:hypothetical protein
LVVFLSFAEVHGNENVQFSYLSYISSSGAIESEYPNTLRLNSNPNRVLTKSITDILKKNDPRIYNLFFGNMDSSNTGSLSLVIAIDKERIYSFKFDNKCLSSYFISTQTILFDPRDQKILSIYPNASRRMYIDPLQEDCNIRNPTLDFIRFSEFYLGLELNKSQIDKNLILSDSEIISNLLNLSLKNDNEISPIQKSFVITPVVSYINKLNPYKLKYADNNVGINIINITDESFLFFNGDTFNSPNKYFMKGDIFSKNEYKNWLGQQFVKWFSDKYSYPVIPYSEGEALGRQVNLKFADRDELLNLVLPPLDYAFNLTIKPHRKVLIKENSGIKAFAYASYADLSFVTMDGSLEGIHHFTHSIKNGLVDKIVGNDETDDWENFNNSTNELLLKYIDNLQKKDKTYIKNFTSVELKRFKKDINYLTKTIGIEYEN